MNVVKRGIMDKKPLALYAALLMTTWGHSLPEVNHFNTFGFLWAASWCSHYTVVVSAFSSQKRGPRLESQIR